MDTNVLAVAEGLHDGASDECVAACSRLARQIQDGKILVAVDSEQSGEAVLREYLAVLNTRNKAGIGSKLAVRLWRLRHDSKVCRRVDINAVPGADTYQEVPADLHDFDPDDHKWIAIAAADQEDPPIYQAHDKEWWERREDFVRSGVDVQFLCASDLVDDMDE
ncbi:MAG TPA: hypothetical protein VG820_04095 [Fimbriimonadaceae bacterium]|nr:hypothetical protein [Fimbriimonadaceae bacterium]